MEIQPPHGLRRIHADIACADRKTLEQRELNIYGQKLFQKALDTLHKYGEQRQKSVGGWDLGIIGYPSERHHFLETPPVTVNMEGNSVQLTIAEDFTLGPGLHLHKVIAKDKIVVRSTSAPDLPQKEERQLFLIGQNGKEAINWLGEPATIEQIEMASEAVSFIGQSLAEIHG